MDTLFLGLILIMQEFNVQVLFFFDCFSFLKGLGTYTCPSAYIPTADYSAAAGLTDNLCELDVWNWYCSWATPQPDRSDARFEVQSFKILPNQYARLHISNSRSAKNQYK